MLRALRRSLSIALCAAWLCCLLFRLDLLQAYGSGTGRNKLAFSPLDVACFSAIHTARVRGSEDLVRPVAQVIGVPGEAYRSFLATRSVNPKQVWDSSLKWTKDPKMKQLVDPKKEPLVTVASLGSVLCILLLFVFPKEASLLFLISLVCLQTAMKTLEPSVKITEDVGMYSIGLAIASYVLS